MKEALKTFAGTLFIFSHQDLIATGQELLYLTIHVVRWSNIAIEIHLCF